MNVQSSSGSKPRVQSYITDQALKGLLVMQVCYVAIHTTVYIVTLNFWRNFNGWYLFMYIIQEIPNLYALVLCGATFLDKYSNFKIESASQSLQRSLYFWKPIVDLIALLMLII